jgi:hypothetical protein
MKLKFINLWREAIPTSRKDLADKYVPYGEHDTYPLELAQTVNKSVIASSCVSTRADFIEGEGFNDSAWNDLVINSLGETLGELNRKVAESQSMFYGYYIRIVYSRSGDPLQYYFLPFENCRLGIPDDTGYIAKILYNPNFGTGHFKSKETIYYDTYSNDKSVILQQIAQPDYKGHVFFWGTTSPLDRVYPRPDYYESAKPWMRVDYRTGNYHDVNLRNGFLQPIMLTVVGDPTAPSTDPDYQGKNVGEVFDEQMTENFSGTERVGSIWVQWVRNKDEASTIQQFPGNNQEGYMNSLVDRTREIITAATKVPGILANINQGAQLGGDGNVIRAAVKLMQQRVIRWHHVNERNYTSIFDRYAPAQNIEEPPKLVHYNPFPELSTIDPLVWAELSPDEKRRWIKDNTEIELDEAMPIAPQLPNAMFRNFSYTNYPQKARDNAAKAKKYNEQLERGCVSKAGIQIMDTIISGGPLTFEVIKRIQKYLTKNADFKDSPFNTTDCYAVLYQSWGGYAMLQWCNEKIDEIMK